MRKISDVSLRFLRLCAASRTYEVTDTRAVRPLSRLEYIRRSNDSYHATPKGREYLRFAEACDRRAKRVAKKEELRESIEHGA